MSEVKRSVPEPVFAPPLRRALDDLRRGTLDQYESDWFWLEPNGSSAGAVAYIASRRHNLDQIPATVYVEFDDTGDGRNAVDATANVTVTRDRDEITVQNDDTAEGHWCRIRAR